jgi:DNA-binding NtrC family response regulator
VNCAAIPENLLESELFGHEKGAFTGATARRIGKFEEAHMGTILLDEVTEMHPLLQAKLLRAIQEREITRIGSNASVKVDVRILATSNRNMEQAVKEGQFREDLYFRLNVVNIRLPALRERPADIPKLAQFFADKYAEVNGLAKKKLAADALVKIKSGPWKGNIRELENAMHRAILVSIEDEIEPESVHMADSPSPLVALPEGKGKDGQRQGEGEKIQTHKPQNTADVQHMIGRTIQDVERDMIINTLDHCLGNRTQAANILGISIRTLRNKLNEYKIASGQ